MAIFIILFGVTTGPEDPLFKIFKSNWDSLDFTDIELPDIPATYSSEVKAKFEYITCCGLRASNVPRQGISVDRADLGLSKKVPFSPIYVRENHFQAYTMTPSCSKYQSLVFY